MGDEHGGLSIPIRRAARSSSARSSNSSCRIAIRRSISTTAITACAATAGGDLAGRRTRPLRRAGQRGAGMKTSFSAPASSGTATAYFLAKQGREVEVVERQSGAALETSFGQWRRHPRQRGRALVAAGHAAQDPAVARQGECAAAGALRRHPAYVALGLELHRAIARPEGSPQFLTNLRLAAAQPEDPAGDPRGNRDRLRPAHDGRAEDLYQPQVLARWPARRRIPGRGQGLIFEPAERHGMRRPRAGLAGQRPALGRRHLFPSDEEIGDSHKFTHAAGQLRRAGRRFPLRNLDHGAGARHAPARRRARQTVQG